MSSVISLNLLQSLIYLGYFCFAMGLLVAVKKLRRSPLSHADVDGRDEGLDLLTGLIAFCFLSSAVMLLPGLAELLLRIDSSTALQLHRLGLYVLMLLVGCTSIAGFIDRKSTRLNSSHLVIRMPSSA